MPDFWPAQGAKAVNDPTAATGKPCIKELLPMQR